MVLAKLNLKHLGGGKTAKHILSTTGQNMATWSTYIIQLVLVRSFGTEDRPTDRPVAPRDEIFEYIIFRGSDIKDLHVCEPPKPQPSLSLPQDPAIVKVRCSEGMWFIFVLWYAN